MCLMGGGRWDDEQAGKVFVCVRVCVCVCVQLSMPHNTVGGTYGYPYFNLRGMVQLHAGYHSSSQVNWCALHCSQKFVLCVC